MDRTERFYKIKELLRQRHFLNHGTPCEALGTDSLRQVGLLGWWLTSWGRWGRNIFDGVGGVGHVVGHCLGILSEWTVDK